MTTNNPIRKALDKAEELHAVWLGAQMASNTAKAKAQDDRKALEDQHRASLQAIERASAGAEAAEKAARDALEAHQKQAFEELHIGIDLLQASGSGGGRTSL